MKVSEFIRRKNEIVKKYTGIDLVPEDQIEDISYNGKLYMLSNGYACPYCRIFNKHVYDDCGGCPMKNAGNECGVDDFNTYAEITKTFCKIVNESAPWYDELRALVDEWNKDLEKEE